MSFSIDALNPELCVTVPIIITDNGHKISTKALLDSGAEGNFVLTFLSSVNIALIHCSFHLTVEAIDGCPLGSGRVSFITQELLMQTKILHTEKIQLYILPTLHTPVILSLPWLHRLPHVWKIRSPSYSECPEHVSPLPV